MSKTFSTAIQSLMLLCLLGTPCLSKVTSHTNWHRFRGPNGQGVVEPPSVPVRWDADSVAWKTTLSGTGHSSPVIWQQQVYVTYSTKDPLQGVVAALDAATGHILWEVPTPLKKSRMNSLNNAASSTPAIDADGLYVMWPDGDDLLLTALGHNGKKRWSKSYGRVHGRHGICVSPMLYQDLIIFSQEQYEKGTEQPGRWLAVDCKDGDIRWELKRNNRSPSYVTPCLYTAPSGQEQLIFTSQAHGVTAVAPDTGELLWELPDVLPDRTIGSPVLAEDCIVATGGSGGGGKRMVFVRPGTKTSQPELLRTIKDKLTPYTPTMLVLDNRLYTFHDRGAVACWDIQTGKPLWSESLKHRFFGSPIAVGDYLYCISIKGDVVVLKAGESYQEPTVMPLGQESQATPAVSNGRLFLRTLSNVTCVTSTR